MVNPSIARLPRNIKEISGVRHGRLTVLSFSHTAEPPRKGAYWLCRCDCGNEKVLKGASLGKTTFSCGCLHRDKKIELCKARATHGLSKTKLAGRYSAMLLRCNPLSSSKRTKTYTSRGITVCGEWKTNPGAFYKWAIENGYREDLELDRIDNAKGYSPDNCRWVSRQENCNNKSTNITLTYDGISLTIAQWSRRIGIKQHTMYRRFRDGWSAPQVLGYEERQNKYAGRNRPGPRAGIIAFTQTQEHGYPLSEAMVWEYVAY